MKFSIDIEQITIGELLDAEKDAGVMFGLIARCLIDDVGTPISEEVGIQMLREKSVREYNVIQIDFLANMQSVQATALTSANGQRATR